VGLARGFDPFVVPLKLPFKVIVGAASVGSGVKAAKAMLLTQARAIRLAKAMTILLLTLS
jgi:hypothetical protein